MMKRMLFGLILLSSPAFSQLSVFTCDGYNDPTQAEILSSNGNFYRGCIDLSHPGNYLLQQNFPQDIKANNSIHITDVFHAGPYTSTANTHLLIGTSSPFDVAVMNYPAMNYVWRYKKLELGVVLPEPYKTYVQNFETKEILPDVSFPDNQIINPFLESELDVEAHFHQIGTSTEIVVDGYFTNEIARNYTTNDWDATPSNYPMRIRFAPPENGNWECYIVIKTGSNGTVVSTSATFPFTVVESGNPGYVTAHDNHKNLKRGGNMIFPLGQNFAAPCRASTDLSISGLGQSKAVPVSAWKRYMDSIENYINMGGKYIRTNQVVQGNLLEWEKKGNYYKRLHYAWEQDKLLELLEANDVLMLFNLMNQEPMMLYGNYRMWDQDWDYWQIDTATHNTFFYNPEPWSTINPYNDNPGVKQPYEMFTNASDLEYHKQRTRYYIARYGYSTSVYAFELLNETWHLGEKSPDNNYPHEPGGEPPYNDPSDPDHYNVKNALANYTNVIGNYIKNHLHSNQLVMANAVQTIWNPDSGVTGHDASIYSPYIDLVGVNYYNYAPKKMVISELKNSNENGMTKCMHDFSSATGKPIIMSECGSKDGTIECGLGAGEFIDVMTYGFTGVGGFNMWHALYANKYGVYQAGIRAMQHMNAHTLTTLSNGGGDWGSDRDIQNKDSDNKDIKEIQFYIAKNKETASGYVRNRTYNVRTVGSYYNGDCANIGFDGDAQFNNFEEVNWNDGSSNALKLTGLKHNVDYKIEYYSFRYGNYLGEECRNSSSTGKIDLHHPTLLPSGTMDNPIVWFIAYQYNCQQDIAQNESIEQTQDVISFETAFVEENKESQFSIFPNPTNANITVVVKQPSYYRVFDNMGAVLLEGSVMDVVILDLSRILKGMYAIELKNEKETIVEKIVKY